MRLYLYLILIAVFIAFFTGYYSLIVQGTGSAGEEDILTIRLIKNQFLSKAKPKTVLKVGHLFRGNEQTELLLPIHPFKRTQSLQNVDPKVFLGKEKCFQLTDDLKSDKGLEKFLIWEEYRCEQRNRLPSSFFYRPPYMHPSGQSYAAMALKFNSSIYSKKKWVQDHIGFFHISELGSLKGLVDELPGIFGILEKFDQDTFPLLMNGVEELIVDDLFLSKNPTDFDFSTIEYSVYTINQLNLFLQKGPYYVRSFEPGTKCYYQSGNICWDYSFRHLFSVLGQGSVIVFGVSLVLIILVVYLLFNKIQQDRLEGERRRLALQVLTHEFRTPVASALFGIEELQRGIESFAEQDVETVLRLSDDIHRLHRLTESSRNYMKAIVGKGLIDFKNETHKSFFQLIQKLIESENQEITLNFKGEDRAWSGDEYWLGIVLKNLVENAFRHGKPPVEVEIQTQSQNIYIRVKDQGKCEFQSLEEMVGEFTKGGQSSGSGLGLNIVEKVCKAMGAELSFNHSPTTFTIKLKGEKNA